MAEYHIRASQWYEDNGLEIEAFHHAAAANDVERAERLIEGGGIPRHFRGAATAILSWLASLPTTVLDARPSLWAKYAQLLLVTGQTTGVEEKLQAAEVALQDTEPNDKTQNLVGQIAAARATLALTRYQVETMIAQSRRALEYLHPNNLRSRATAHWTLGYAYLLQGDRVAASRALTEAISISQTSGDIFTTILATIGLGNVQEVENRLYLAAETYRRVLQLADDQPSQIVYEAHLGLARVLYEWNDLDAAQQHGEQSLQLARQYDNKVIDRFVVCEVFLARLKLARGDVAGAAAILAKADQSVRQHNFVFRMLEVAAAQVLTLLQQGNLAAAAHLAQTYELPLSRARVHLAQGDSSAALAALEPLRQQVEAKGWEQVTSPRLAGQLVLSAFGLVFLFAGIGTRTFGFLVPGGILSGLGLGMLLIAGPLADLDRHATGAIFMMCFAFGWFLITLLSQLAGGRVHWWPLIPGGIIGAIGLAHLAGVSAQDLSYFNVVWPLLIIALGLYLLFGRRTVAQG